MLLSRREMDRVASLVASRIASRVASARPSERIRLASARAASRASASRVSASRISASLQASRIASLVARRQLGARYASKRPVDLLASGTAHRFASWRTQNLVASIVVRRLASAVSRHLAAEDSPLVKQFASGIASRLTSTHASETELPVEKDA